MVLLYYSHYIVESTFNSYGCIKTKTFGYCQFNVKRKRNIVCTFKLQFCTASSLTVTLCVSDAAASWFVTLSLTHEMTAQSNLTWLEIITCQCVSCRVCMREVLERSVYVLYGYILQCLSQVITSPDIHGGNCCHLVRSSPPLRTPTQQSVSEVFGSAPPFSLQTPPARSSHPPN